MTMVSLNFAEHEAFLRLVHSAPGGGDELYIGCALPGAIQRYLNCWLPLLARAVGGNHEVGNRLIPPVDIAWVWHLHRLAPRRYAMYCTERFGRVLDPKAAAFKAQCTTAAEPDDPVADDETRRLWQEHFSDEPFFQRRGEDASSAVEWGPRDPLSNQTTLCAKVKEACAQVRSAHGFGYDVETCSARQRTFLWQVSQPACSDGPAVRARYLQFLGLMKKHGYGEHFFVPTYDIDFAWHTHMLTSTTAYLRESELLAAAPGGVDHDDSVNQRNQDSKLHLGWLDTKQLWAMHHGDTADGIDKLDKSGVTYRGEPPDWWFKADGADIYRVRDDFLTGDEVSAALEQLRCEANVRGRAHSGFDMVCQVSGDVIRRLDEQLEGEPAVAGQGGAESPEQVAVESGQGGAESPEQVAVESQENREQVLEDKMVEVPARVCPASKSVPQHKDKKHGKGAVLSSWICVVYLTDQPGSALVLVDDVTGREFSVAIRSGRMCCWPNARFSHRVDVDPAVAGGSVAAQLAELASCRCMLGPMAFSQSPGPGSSCKEIVYAEGGCGGGGCGGGGCGGGGCGGGGYGGGGYGGGGCGGGGGEPPIKESARVRILGTSNLRDVVRLTQGTADMALLGATFVPWLYDGVHTNLRKTKITAVPYMREAAISQALWQQLQQDISGLEVQLAQID